MKLLSLILIVNLYATLNHKIVYASYTLGNDNSEETIHHVNSTNISTSTTRTLSNTTRTIQRLVGGHLQNDDDGNQQQTNARQTTRERNSNLYFRRKSPSTPNPIDFNRFSVPKIFYADRELLDDAVLLNDNSIDSSQELSRASAGAGPELTTPSSGTTKKDSNAKTLSDQVAEGKYALIEKELFGKPPKRPGIISYSANPEVPADTVKNLGGLEPDDIWLAEDHLLILRGGGLNEKDRNEEWTPIDNYEAPLRQVKIPDNPKVPPPFPVQLEENGPIQFIGNNQFPIFNPFANESFGFGEAPQGGPYGGYPPNLPTGFGPFENSSFNNGFGPTPSPIPPWLFNNNETFKNPFINGPPIPGGPFPPDFPSGNGTGPNGTDPFDEDDPRLYYPPPYSFVYKSNYTSLVPPGPLVPGIVLPPPPNFFSRLRKEKSKTRQKTKISPNRQQLKPVGPTSIPAIISTPKVVITNERVPYKTTTLKPVIVDDRDKYYVPNYVDSVRTSPKNIYVEHTTPNSIPRPTKVIANKPSISFVPKISPETNAFRNEGNPIYYEYFDAQRGNKISSSTPIQQINQIENSSPDPSYVYRSQEPKRTYLPTKFTSSYDYDPYYYATPTPEIQTNVSPNQNYQPSNYDEKLPYKTITSFEHEIDTIRKTLQYYKNAEKQLSYNGASYTPSQISQTQPPRTAKAKAVYEYSFDAGQGTTPNPYKFNGQNIQYDSTPFKPVVQYSSPYDSSDGFKAVSYATTELPKNFYTSSADFAYNSPKLVQVARNRGKILNINPLIQSQQEPIYNSAQTESPPIYYNTQGTTPSYDNIQYYYTTFSPKVVSLYGDAIETSTRTTTDPWFTIEKQNVKELTQSNQQQNIRRPISSGNRGNTHNKQGYNNGYQNERPENTRTNGQNTYNPNEQFHKQINKLRNELRNQYSTNDQYDLSLINDTYVNTRHPRPHINPDSEYFNREQYVQPNINSYNNNQQYSNKYSPQFQQQSIPSPNLQHDTLVNYRYPLPEINPDAEYIVPQNYLSKYNTNQNPVIKYRLPGEQQAHVYFITPRELDYEKK